MIYLHRMNLNVHIQRQTEDQQQIEMAMEQLFLLLVVLRIQQVNVFDRKSHFIDLQAVRNQVDKAIVAEVINGIDEKITCQLFSFLRLKTKRQYVAFMYECLKQENKNWIYVFPCCSGSIRIYVDFFYVEMIR